MATYKVIQDIEADDKLLWQLSFRQFIYALVAFFMLYISYIGYTKSAPYILIITVPAAAFTGFLAFPFGKDQPTEVWAIARLRFLFKPRKRIWAQSGVKELVTINVPKHIEIDRTDGLSQYEVKSRLQVLANTIDSRGWAIKNASGVYQNPITTNDSNDRLISASTLPKDVPDYVIPDSDDVLDVDSNPLAHQMDQLLSANGSLRRQQLLENLNKIKTDNTQSTPQTPAALSSVPTPEPEIFGEAQAATANPNDAGLNTALKSLNETQHIQLNNMRSLNPDIEQPAAVEQPETRDMPVEAIQAPATPQMTTSTRTTDPVILNLSKRNDLNVTVIAHEASKAKAKSQAADGEVLISLR
ncbi:MAG TPA: PrgI family protein [Candidatus Saccharimonadales bacterium]